MTRYRWVAARKAEGFPTSAACAVAKVPASGFYEWVTREAAGPTPAQLAEETLVERIRQLRQPVAGPRGD